MAITGLAADPSVRLHDGGRGHPEQPARFTAIYNQLKSSGLIEQLAPLQTRAASDDELALVHTRDYIALVNGESAAGRGQLSTGDTPINAHSEKAARLAAGCALAAVDAVFSNAVENAFCAVRPPGHHAGSSRGMGFCIFNSVAVAARHAQRRHLAERVLIVDWDVHHGNGTQDIFYEDGSVLYFSTHQSPWYPGTGGVAETGEGAGAGKTINAPLPAGTGSAKMFEAFRERLLPAVEQFHPDLVMLSTGFDSRAGDPLGQFLLQDHDFRVLTEMMTELAGRHCGGRLVSVLEGGYNLEGLALATETHVRALLGKS